MIQMSEKLQSLMNEMKTASAETYYHAMNVKDITVKMIRRMNGDGVTAYTPAEIDAICKGALLHDVGKLRIKNAILTKTSSLTEAETSEIRKHTEYSYEAVKDELNEEEAEIIKNICLYHHERIDGSGYYHKKRLPRYVQIVSLCDAFSALFFDRIYREALSYAESMQLLEEGKSGYFSPLMMKYLKEVTATQK